MVALVVVVVVVVVLVVDCAGTGAAAALPGASLAGARRRGAAATALPAGRGAASGLVGSTGGLGGAEAASLTPGDGPGRSKPSAVSREVEFLALR